MTHTSHLIELLASDLKPVRRLLPPPVRAACWALVAAVVVLLLATGQGFRPDMAERMGETSFALGVAAMLATALCGALAAFALAVPGRSRWWAAFPFPPLLVWVSIIGHQCLTDWVKYDADGMAMGETARCFATLALSSLPLWLLMLLMLRRTRAIQALPSMLAGGLAVAAMAATAMTMVHQLDASAMILLWNFGTGSVIVGASTLFARPMLQRSPA